MKFIHLSDLHLGKTVSSIPMLEEQKHILFDQIIPAIKDQQPDGVLIAGDIFDRANPSAEALELFDDFLFELTRLPKRTEVFVISGNHDGEERIAYGARILDKSGLHMSPVYDGTVKPFVMNDEYGELAVYMLPFLKKATVKYFFPDEEIESESSASAAAVRNIGIDTTGRCVCIAHQFVNGAAVSGAEETNVGGLDSVSTDCFSGIDYVALGHIHRPQNVCGNIRYSGSPLKYSFAEVNHKKSMTMVEVKGKGDVTVTEIPLSPINDWFDIRGEFSELTSEKYLAEHPDQVNGYLRITLTDENTIIDGYKSLKAVFPNMMELHYDNSRTRALGITSDGVMETATDEDFIKKLFALQNGREMDEKELNFINTFLG